MWFRGYESAVSSAATCLYLNITINTLNNVQLLAIWRIPLLPVVLLLSPALHVAVGYCGDSPPCSFCLSRFRNNRLKRRALCTSLFSQVGCFFTLPVVDPSPRAHVFAVTWPLLKCWRCLCRSSSLSTCYCMDSGSLLPAWLLHISISLISIHATTPLNKHRTQSWY